MRIYEIAKEAGVSSADVLKAAEAAGVSASSAISSVDDGEVASVKAALAKQSPTDTVEKRAAKSSRAVELNARFFAEQKAKLEEHLRIAKEAAEGKISKPKSKVEGEQRTDKLQPSPSSVKPALRMAPGFKPKVAVKPVSAAKTGLTAAGFKPLQHSAPTPTISISVAAVPKPKKVVVDDYEDERGRKGKKGRDAQRAFEKQRGGVPRVAQVVPQQGSRISVDEATSLTWYFAFHDGKDFTDKPITPCGACRQVMLETETRGNREMTVLLFGKQFVWRIVGVEKLLPFTFSSDFIVDEDE